MIEYEYSYVFLLQDNNSLFMKNNKILMVLILLLQGICSVGYAQKCNQGQQELMNNTGKKYVGSEVANKDIGSEASRDPNEIIGLDGYNAPESTDTLRWVSATQSLTYTIYFENDAELAMAAASKVTITVPLHDKLNYATFGVGSFGFGSHIIAVEGSPSSYQTRIDLRDSLGIFLDVVAGLDIVHNEAFWIFQSIDPATGLPPTDINLGFLPINDSLHSGEGFVTCTIKPKAGECVTGDTVSATASIVFDVNEAIPTNTWVNTIDAVAPTSTLTVTPNAAGDMLTATFAGEDDAGGCGIKQYKLYYSVNGGAYQLYDVYPAGSTAEIPVETGMEYEFFTLAEDNVGNCEPMKNQPEYNIGINFVTLVLNAFPQEAGTVTGGGTYSVNDIAQLTATAAEGYHFVNWMSQGVPVSTNNPYSAAVSQNQTYTAYFERNAYTLQTIAATGSSITFTDLNGNEVPSGSTILHFDKLIVSTDTADCYAMESVSLNGVAYVPGDTLTVTGDIVLSAQTEPLIIQTDTTATACELFVWYGETLTETAEYTKTFTNAAGCDSVVTLHLTINHGIYTETTVDTCGTEYYWALADTTVNQSGTYYHYSTNANTCIDTAVLMLALYQSARTELSVQICAGEVYDQNGFNVSTAGDHYLNLQTAHGCDSIVHLTLTVNRGTYTETAVDTCGTEYYWAPADTIVNQSGTYYYYSTNANTCTDTAVLMLSLYQSATTELSAQICAGEVYDQNGFNVGTAGDHYLNLQTENGCDSIVHLTLTVNRGTYAETTVDTCGNEYYWALADTTVNQSGTYYYYSINANTCIDTTVLMLSLYQSVTTELAAQICAGEVYDQNGFNASTAGDHYLNLQTVHGCDSIVHLTITVNHGTYTEIRVDTCCTEYYWALADTTVNQSGTYYYYSTNANTCTDTAVLLLSLYQSAITELSAQICAGEVYDQNGFNVSTAGDHYLNLQTAHGCDSTVVLHLTVGSEAVTYLAASICVGDSYQENGFEIVAPAVGTHMYSDTIGRPGTCDSIVHLTLTVNHGTYAETTVDTCGTEYYWALADTTVNQSGSYYYYSTNANTCTDTTVLMLALYQSATTELSAQICAGEVYDQNGFNVSTAGDHYLNLQTVHGCDSTVILHLTVGSEAVSYLAASICEGDSYQENGFEIIAPAAGVHEYSDTIGRVGTCDSIVHLTLTVNRGTYTETTVDTCGTGYYWALADSTINQSGMYYHYSTNANTCIDTAVLMLSLYQSATTELSAQICAGEVYNQNGFNVSTAGDHYLNLQTTYGCDSTVVLHLAVGSEAVTYLAASICEGDSYQENGFEIIAPSVGTHEYSDTIERTGTCDSIVHLTLTVNRGTYTETTVDTCGTEYYWALADTTVNQSGTYYHYSTNANTCIDTAVLMLALYQSARTELSVQICAGEVYDQNGFNVSTAGDHYLNLQTEHGCDSTVILHLTVGSEAVTYLAASICEGDSYHENGFEIIAPSVGTYMYSDTIERTGTCDSIVHLTLTVNHGTYTEATVDTCGNEYYWALADTTVNQSGTYYYYSTNANTCTDTAVMVLALYQSATTELSAQICAGEVYDQNGFDVSTAGDHYLNLQTAHGCDSTVVLHLTVGSEAVTYLAASICVGDSYQENGFEIVAPAVGTHMYSDTIGRVGTCDSIVHLTLTVNRGTYTETAVDTCGTEYYWTLADTTVNQSGTYYHYSTNANTCTDTAVLMLALYQSATTELSAQICAGEVYDQNGFNVSTAGDHYLNLLTEHGCDSTVILHLTVSSEAVTYLAASICEGDSYQENGFEIIAPATGTHMYSDTIARLGTCDSVISLTLTVNAATSGDTTAVVNSSFDWYGQHLTTSGDYTSTLTNAAGCDSVVTLHLTVNHPVVTGDTTAIACDRFDWYEHTNLTQSGDYVHTFTNIAGGDSVVTLHLTFVEPPVLQTITGEPEICINQYATYHYDISDPNYQYRWLKDNVLWGENVPVMTLHEMGEGVVLVTLQVTDGQSGCAADTSMSVQVTNRIAPDTTEVRRKGSSNILVCRLVYSDYGQVHYRWGYTDLSTFAEVVIPGDHNYCLYDIGIDTLTYRYWVETYLNEAVGAGCENRSYYAYDYITTFTPGYGGNIVDAFLSGGRIMLNVSALSPEDVDIALYDMNGKLLLTKGYGVTELVSDVIPVSFAPGIYLLNVNVGGYMYSFKLLKM